MKKKFDVIEEDGVVIYDESDDYDAGEDEVTETDKFRLKTNEEIFTDEYMLDYAEKMDAKIAREKRMDHIISASVIIGIVLYIALVVYINFRRIL